MLPQSLNGLPDSIHALREILALCLVLCEGTLPEPDGSVRLSLLRSHLSTENRDVRSQHAQLTIELGNGCLELLNHHVCLLQRIRLAVRLLFTKARILVIAG